MDKALKIKHMQVSIFSPSPRKTNGVHKESYSMHAKSSLFIPLE